MPHSAQPLDGEALRRLRQLVRNMQEHNGHGVPRTELLGLVRDVRLNAGLTIDFEATRELGQPMVVLRVAEKAQPASCLDGLSARESEVAALMAAGLKNREIAEQLCISLGTVKDHVHNILDKTGLSSRSAVIAAFMGADYKPSR